MILSTSSRLHETTTNMRAAVSLSTALVMTHRTVLAMSVCASMLLRQSTRQCASDRSADFSVVSVTLEQPHPASVSPPHSVDPRHASVDTQGTRESLSATVPLPLQLRPAGSWVQRSRSAPSADAPKLAHGRSLIHTVLSSSGRSSAAPTCRGSRARSQPQPYPGSPSYPVTPLIQLGRVRGDRRSGPSSAAEVSPGCHFVFGDGTGAARQRGPLSPGAPRRSLPGAQGSQGLLKRRLRLGEGVTPKAELVNTIQNIASLTTKEELMRF
ncbi:hypothetical protein NDU88_000042 [Pleurodeles waltl]|uniref:Uncharacterized protein n=1 Tax=Pleurodeles waltl TaxID=8319 RepID=A0AAV7TEJ1_PLEWA|nr:hypothetical protein NDU88_000042 [Pleurodeles waltl]